MASAKKPLSTSNRLSKAAPACDELGVIRLHRGIEPRDECGTIVQHPVEEHRYGGMIRQGDGLSGVLRDQSWRTPFRAEGTP